jgi:ribonuclease HII
VKSFLLPTLDAERRWWRQGIERIAGVDEVGRGALAGPLIAAAVVLPRCGRTGMPRLTGLRDSKLLTAAQRESWLELVLDVASAVGLGVVEVPELDELGLGAANRIAMERAVFNLGIDPDAVLLDAAVTELPQPQVGIIDGDARCLSIAAASIVAKVTRDRIMTELDRYESRYGFAMHKGYGTASHMEALRRFGPSAIHRRTFAPIGALASSN